MTVSVSNNGTSSLAAPAGAASEEVVARPTRRRFSAQYKLSVLHEAERCAPGELGALLRRGEFAAHRPKRLQQFGHPVGFLQKGLGEYRVSPD